MGRGAELDDSDILGRRVCEYGIRQSIVEGNNGIILSTTDATRNVNDVNVGGLRLTFPDASLRFNSDGCMACAVHWKLRTFGGRRNVRRQRSSVTQGSLSEEHALNLRLWLVKRQTNGDT